MANCINCLRKGKVNKCTPIEDTLRDGNCRRPTNIHLSCCIKFNVTGTEQYNNKKLKLRQKIFFGKKVTKKVKQTIRTKRKKYGKLGNKNTELFPF